MRPSRATTAVARLIPRRRLRLIATTALIGLLALIAAEAIGRRFPDKMPVQWQIEYFSIHYPFRVVPDTEIGYAMPANQHEIIRTHDYAFLAETDSRGYPNRDPWPTDPRLVFLGDSLLIGAGVGLDGSFPGLVAQRFPDQPQINLGLAGAGLARQVRIYRRHAGHWRPRVVVSCLFLTSDFENDSHFDQWLRDGEGRDYNRFRLDLARQARDRGILQRILDKSWILDRGMRTAGEWTGGASFQNRHRFPDGNEILFERHAVEFARAPAESSDPRLEAFSRSLRELRSLVEGSGATLLVALIPSKEELFEAPEAAAAQNLAARARERLAAMDLPVLDLYPVLQTRGRAQAVYYGQDIHLNILGNQIVAEEFSAWFERALGWISRDRAGSNGRIGRRLS